MQLTIIGLGVNSGDLSLKAFETIKSNKTILLRTEKTLSAEFLRQNGITYISLDDVYVRSRNFDSLTKNLVKAVEAYLKNSDVCYLVDGAVCEDSSSCALMKKHKNAVVFEGVSKAQNALSKCGVFGGNYTAVSAYNRGVDTITLPLVIFDVDSVILASEWKIKLINWVGEEQKVWLYSDKMKKQVCVYELDRFVDYDYSTAIIVEETPFLQKERYNYGDLVSLVKLLRAPNGCPWDRMQTKESIRKNLIEECYELCEAIDLNDDDKMLEEIGDVMLQTVFHTVFAEERKAFNSVDVFTDECKKLIFRHSHIFGKDKAENSDLALDVWDKNKLIEKGFDTPIKYVSDVPKVFPSLLRAQKIIKRISKYAVDAPFDEATKDCIKNILASKDCFNNSEKMGLLLLAICGMLKNTEVSAEETLGFAIDKLVSAFAKANGENFKFSEFFKEEIK